MIQNASSSLVLQKSQNTLLSIAWKRIPVFLIAMFIIASGWYWVSLEPTDYEEQIDLHWMILNERGFPLGHWNHTFEGISPRSYDDHTFRLHAVVANMAFWLTCIGCMYAVCYWRFLQSAISNHAFFMLLVFVLAMMQFALWGASLILALYVCGFIYAVINHRSFANKRVAQFAEKTACIS